MPLEEELLSIERDLWSAGSEAYRRYLDEDCLVVFSEMSGVWSREDVAEMVEGSERWRDVEIELEGFVRPGPDFAVLTYRARAVRGEGDSAERY